ncbi:hypothetical protein C5167_000237 [Papaver somniferum]|uniref:Uncharacterized protein n=1 Tax=Papaver somniferum TaxID=3469 RepID=A0A4Y7KTN5_PAPSO|nr:transcription termination factor MTERF8, chloroplastic-like [Papaver somniferum]XP_026414480.1 transcription termination factor MTERF8, chloroplastic-like [Papaver somniferum]XP_026414481.1 transcription termination factor MTERF8, chloroplastic-like [Papaver somniferum]XP_026414482.1 transcription termination factor MTERF8, chloroplastic-like [Papaver somniferum]XP_026414483.1 transcription termination factor MTERF8, chloroplastic-like [Papaver somniferum]RZC75772.1 hypothetical protein C51
MFRSLRTKLIRNRIINGVDSKPLCVQNPCFILLHHVKVRFVSSSSSFVVCYLMNSCGLTEKQALSASKKLNFKTSSKPDTVLTFFQDYGFTKPDISKIITREPVILSLDARKTLKPKLDYFNSKEISRLEIIKLLSTNSTVLTRSLQNHIIPFFNFIKNIVGTDRYTCIVFRRTMFPPVGFIEKMKLNLQVLRDEGVPQSKIVKFLISHPRSLCTGKFKDIIQEIKGMGFDPHKYAFTSAIHALSAMSKSTWEMKLNVFRKWGWSDSQIQNAFIFHPQCMKHSEKMISAKMDYLVNQMGISSPLIARCPVILNYSLEKRIIPRCSFYQSLVSKGLIEKDKIRISSLLCITEKSFLDKYVIKYQQEAPELLKVKELSGGIVD